MQWFGQENSVVNARVWLREGFGQEKDLINDKLYFKENGVGKEQSLVKKVLIKKSVS